MSSTVGIAELRQNLSVYLARVAEGERLVVTDRNRPVAELAPITNARLARLVEEGKLIPARKPSKTLPEPVKLDPGEMTTSEALDWVRGER